MNLSLSSYYFEGGSHFIIRSYNYFETLLHMITKTYGSDKISIPIDILLKIVID